MDPGCTTRDAFSRARTEPKCFDTSRSSRTGPFMEIYIYKATKSQSSRGIDYPELQAEPIGEVSGECCDTECFSCVMARIHDRQPELGRFNCCPVRAFAYDERVDATVHRLLERFSGSASTGADGPVKRPAMAVNRCSHNCSAMLSGKDAGTLDQCRRLDVGLTADSDRFSLEARELAGRRKSKLLT